MQNDITVLPCSTTMCRKGSIDRGKKTTSTHCTRSWKVMEYHLRCSVLREPRKIVTIIMVIVITGCRRLSKDSGTVQ